MTANGAYGVWDTVEQRYVGEVHRHLSDVPRRQRADLLATVAADLAERPDADSWEELVDDLGDPATCAAGLRVEHGLPDRVGAIAHLRATRWPTRIVLLAALVLVVGVAANAWRTRSIEAHDVGLANACSGVDTSDPAVTVVQQEAAGVTESRIGYVDGATVGLGLCLFSNDEIEILSVGVPSLSQSLFIPTVTRASSMEDDPDGPSPVLAPTVLRPHTAGLRVVIEGRLSSCEFNSPGGGGSFDTAQVVYRYRGQTRTESLALNTTYTFVSPPDDQCPRSRDHG